MRAEISVSQLWWNPSVQVFFMRGQAIKQLEELIDLSRDCEDTLYAIEDEWDDLDDLEEDLYSMTTEELIEKIGEEYFHILNE